MIAVLITVISAGGYIFLHTCNITRYKTYRSSVKKLNVNSVIVGFISLNVCLFLYFLNSVFSEDKSIVESFVKAVNVYSESDSNIIPIFATLSVILSVSTGITVNVIQKAYFFTIVSWRNYFSENTYYNFWYNSYIDAKYQLNLYLLKENDFEALALESMYREMLVSVTLTSGKVYIGSIKTLPNFTNEREYLNLLPVLSGYRNNEQSLIVNTDYIELVENYGKELEVDSYADDDFDLVIKYEHIVSINLFDPDIYEANIDKMLSKQYSDDNIPPL